MKIEYGKPIDKGVSRLMYVGDDLQPGSVPVLTFLLAVVAVAYVADMFRAKR